MYYGQFVSLYAKRIFFVDDSGPPLGHALLALGGRRPPPSPSPALPGRDGSWPAGSVRRVRSGLQRPGRGPC